MKQLFVRLRGGKLVGWSVDPERGVGRPRPGVVVTNHWRTIEA